MQGSSGNEVCFSSIAFTEQDQLKKLVQQAIGEQANESLQKAAKFLQGGIQQAREHLERLPALLQQRTEQLIENLEKHLNELGNREKNRSEENGTTKSNGSTTTDTTTKATAVELDQTPTIQTRTAV